MHISEFVVGKIKAFHEMGLNERQIRERLKEKCSRASVNRIIADKQRVKKRAARQSTAQKKQRAAQERIVLSTLKRLKTKTVPEIKREAKLDCSTTHIRNILIKYKYRAYVMQRVPWNNSDDPAARVKWCQENAEMCKTGAWFDEKIFQLSCNGRQWEWVGIESEDSRRGKPKASHEPRLSVFAGIGPDGWKFLTFMPTAEEIPAERHGRHFVRKTTRKPGETRGRKPLPFNQLKYAKRKPNARCDSELLIDKILEPLVRKFPSTWTLVADNAGIHFSAQTLGYLKRENVKFKPLCPRSPDIQIQENGWAMLQNRVCKRGRAETLEQLKEWIRDEWRQMDVSSLYDSLPRRLAEVIRLKGAPLTRRYRKPHYRPPVAVEQKRRAAKAKTASAATKKKSAAKSKKSKRK